MLYLVSTPIGNLGDISPRAKETLEQADLVACEDTRTSRSLFNLIGVNVKSTVAYHDHNADQMRPKLIQKLKQGLNIALVSDAGTPLVSDPGYKLVRDCLKQQIKVSTVPGANAVLSALQLSGLSSASFYFGGFLPTKSGARKEHLQAVQNLKATLIFYESPNRLIKTLQDLLDVYGNREMAVVREITKKFEETKKDTIANLLAYYTQNGAPKGEIVLVVEGQTKALMQISVDWDKLIPTVRPKYPLKKAAELLATQTGHNKKEIYQIIVEHEKK
ncbi:MAG: 16S rRNA (cytidine(1402)-2'-O)-methyltransferase [Alphaproteobacteria bacterium]|nr:16S rRNA (cytidine(1402)-2'-O)-methyltransferase [Alphaproteobacteria bacterium]